MKKLNLLLFAFGLLFTIASTAQTLSFRFVNPSITNSAGTDYLTFDVQVKADVATTYFWSGQIMLNFNNSSFNTDANLWNVLRAPALSAVNSKGNQKYAAIITSTGTPKVLNIGLVGDVNVLQKAATAADFVLFTTSYQTLVTVNAPITVNTGIAALDFLRASMDGQQSYHGAAGTIFYYTNPNVYDPANFVNTYLGRIYANNVWSQVSGTVNWATAVNTSIWDGAATIPAGSLSTASNLRIHSPATLTIPTTGQLTITGDAEINTASGLTILSDATNTGSLITATTSGTGSASVQRYMAAASWRVATSPVAGQTVGGFLTANGTVATSTAGRGMADYAMLTDTWNAFYLNGDVSSLQVGKGYMLRATTAGAGPVSFTGTLNTATTHLALTSTGNGWNCVGNPFTSAITTATVIANNLGLFPTGFASLYVYNGTSYDIENLANGPVRVQSGQGFFVKAAGTSDFVISSNLKVHDNIAVLKSGNLSSEIKLMVRNDNKAASTLIKFIAGTSKGLDEGYDAGIFKSTLGLDLYTRLVEDNGIDFGLQCLPDNDLNTIIIPVGLDSKAGGEVEFSAELMNLPSDCKVILEDKQSKTFTDLSENDYTTSVVAGSSIADRFQLHTSYQTTGIDGTNLTGKLSAYAVHNTEIRVKGQVSKQAVATLYDVQGRMIVVKNLEEGSLNMIPTPNIRTGIYMLYVKDNGRVQGFKIPVKE